MEGPMLAEIASMSLARHATIVEPGGTDRRMDTPTQQATPEPPAPRAAPERLNLAYHAIIGFAIGVTSLFTGLAWPIAILTGMVIGQDQVERSQGIRRGGATFVLRVLAMTGGVLAMLVLGAIFGGLIAFLIVALAAFSERVAANTTATDKGIARILISLVAVVVWFVAIVVLKLNINLKFG